MRNSSASGGVGYRPRAILLVTLIAIVIAAGLIAASQLSAALKQGAHGPQPVTDEGQQTGTKPQPSQTTGPGAGQEPGGQQGQSAPSFSGQPTLGSPDAPVTIIEFADFQCPFCSAVAGDNPEVIRYLQSRYPGWEPLLPNLEPYIDSGQVRLVFYNFAILGQESIWAAEAAECAFEQGRFWDYYHKLYSNQHGENKGAFVKENLKKFAAELGLDMERFSACLDSDKYAAEVERDKQEIIQMIAQLPESERPRGIGTPGFFIDGRLILGAQSWSTFKAIIEQELQKTKQSPDNNERSDK